MSRYTAEAPKSIARAGSVVTCYDLADHGTAGAVTDQAPAEFDLVDSDVASYHEGLGVFEALTINGQGGTPTSPGAAATFTFQYAFVNTKLSGLAGFSAASDYPTILADLATDFVITLPDSNSAAAAGTRIHRSGDPFIIPGRYLYVWYDRDAFAANALVDIKIDLIRV